MRQVYICTTSLCNLRCKHCYVGEYRANKGFFDEKTTVKWLKNWIKTTGQDESDILFSFHGGEPLLCPLNKLYHVTTAFPSATFNMTSNLVNPLTQSQINFIVQKCVDPLRGKPFIKTSWDYKIRFNEQQFKQWCDNIKTLVSNGVYVKVIVCLTSLLIKDVIPIKLYRMFEHLGIQMVDFERLTYNTTSNKSLIPDYIAQDTWLYNAYIQSKGRKIEVGMFKELQQAIKGYFEGCRLRHCMRDVLTINANGTIGGCPNTSMTESFSNINNDCRDVIFNKIRTCLIKKECNVDKRCLMCDLYPYCNGDCHQLSWQNNVCPAPKKVIRKLLEETSKAH